MQLTEELELAYLKVHLIELIHVDYAPRESLECFVPSKLGGINFLLTIGVNRSMEQVVN